MKKQLLASSALASVLLISGIAAAEISFSGSLRLQLHSNDQANGLVTEINDAQVNMKAAFTTDAGLEVTSKIVLDGQAEDGTGEFGFDDAGVEVVGDFGSITIGSIRNAGGEYLTYAGNIESGTGGTDGNWNSDFAAYPDYFSRDGDAQIGYFSNDFSGFSFGVSLGFQNSGADDSDADNTVLAFTTDVFDFGVGYNFDIGSNSNINLTYANRTLTDTEFNADVDGTAGDEREKATSIFGVTYAVGDLTLLFGSAAIETTTPSEIEEIAHTDFAIAYNYGAGSISYGSSTRTDDSVGATDADVSITSLSADYALSEKAKLTFDQISGEQNLGDPEATTSETIFGLLLSL